MDAVLYALGLMGVGLGGVAAWGFLVEPRLFRLRRVVLPAEALGLPELTLLHLTDTHFCGRDEAQLRFLERLAAGEQFDLVLLTGDLIDRPEGIESAARAARTLRGRAGTFAVLGGHDNKYVGRADALANLVRAGRPRRYSGRNPTEQLVSRMEAEGVRVLQDAAAAVRLGGRGELAVVGLRDAFEEEPDFEAAWRGVAPGVPVIAIAHSPDVVPEVAARGARLALFGHTHGGQVRLPLLGAVVTRTRLPRRLAWGVFRHGETVFVVSSGLGVSPATPVRLFCRPEVVVVQTRLEPPPEGFSSLREAGLG